MNEFLALTPVWITWLVLRQYNIQEFSHHEQLGFIVYWMHAIRVIFNSLIYTVDELDLSLN